MLTIVMIMICGIGTGYLLRNKKMGAIGRIITALIWVLLFLLGIEVGGNPRIVNGLQTLGLEAIALKAIKRLYDKPTINDVKVLADILGESVQNLNLATNETSVSVEVRNATTKRNLERAIREVSKPKMKR